MRRTVSIAVACGVALSLPSIATVSAGDGGGGGGAAARGSVVVDFVGYNPAGADNASNSHLNKEVVVIKNRTGERRKLGGWTLRDKSSHAYRFGRTVLRPGRSVTVHTGRGDNRPGHRYWDQDSYIWNNTGDTATLRNRNGHQIDRCAWEGSPEGATDC